jgi:hypothetical protein
MNNNALDESRAADSADDYENERSRLGTRE